jgi:ADP-heptose:LPS heptosyltransferase
LNLVISADTGPAHLAVAMDMPTITIFISSKMMQYGYNDGKRHFSFELKNPDQTRTFLNKSIQALQNVNG